MNQNVFSLFFVALFLTVCQFGAKAQVQVGVKAAYSLSFARSSFLLFQEDDLLTYEITFFEEDIRPMYGLMGYYEQGKVFVQMEAMYKQTRSRFEAIDWSKIDRVTINDTKVTHFLVLPTLAGYRINNFKLGMGPIFSFILDQNEIFEEIPEFSERRKNLEIGVSMNVGLKLYRLHIDVNYELHFNKVADYVVFNQSQSGFAQSPGYFTLGISYLFF